MKRLVFTLCCLLGSSSLHAVCISQTWDGRPPTSGSRALNAAATELAVDQCAVLDMRGFAAVTIETRPASASQVLTFTGNSIDGNTFTIGATVYTTETGTVETSFEVNDAASAALFIVNLCAAINADGVGDGSDYGAGTTAHPTVTCSASDATTLTVTAITGGSAANTIATTDTTGIAGWGGATLADVIDPIATWSRVDSYGATAHGVITTAVTDTTPERSSFDVDWPFYFVSCTAGGDCVVAPVR